ncbi:MAG: hypothetical protein FWD25_11540 [Clostridia bacterium]|nr:hypothetical protein [Clostridia bacterium]
MTIRTESKPWRKISQNLKFWSNPTFLIELTNVYDAASSAKRVVDEVGDIGSLSVPVTRDHVEALYTHCRKLNTFADGVHYEISKLVDNPFSLLMGDTATAAIDLNPSDIKVSDNNHKQALESLTSLIAGILIDPELRMNFLRQANKLDDDTIEIGLAEAITEAKFWEEQFELARQCRDAGEAIFTDQVHQDWANMTPAEREKILNAYKDALSSILGTAIFGDETPLTPNPVDFSLTGYHWGSSYASPIPRSEETLRWHFGPTTTDDHTISLNGDFIGGDARGGHSLGSAIHTTGHEMRHQYQDTIKGEPKDLPQSVFAEWDKPYIPSYPNHNYTQYYQQPVEADASAFAALSRPRPGDEK